MGHPPTLRFSLLQFCPAGATSSHHYIDSFYHYKELKECISQVEHIEAGTQIQKELQIDAKGEEEEDLAKRITRVF